MAWEAILWVIFFLANMALIALILYQIVCLSDLEADYMNPYESSSRINAVVVPEFVLHGAFCALFLVTGHWFMFLVTVPIACYNVMLFMKRQHLIDVTEVFRSLNAEKKYRIIKLGFYLILFVLVIIRLVLSVIKSIIDEDEVHDFGIF
uniref:Putative Cornichon n=1 Tax=Davidia involucrata TaxID=16924 RepID=A0A5B7AWR1_DAVIN